MADSATVLSPTVNFIETPFDDVLAVICELPLFFISNSSATTLHPLFAGTEIEYSSVGYLSPAWYVLYVIWALSRPNADANCSITPRPDCDVPAEPVCDILPDAEAVFFEPELAFVLPDEVCVLPDTEFW